MCVLYGHGLNGLGKTFVGSEKMMQLGASANLVICQKSKVQDWVDHFKEYYDCIVFDLTKKNEFECGMFALKIPDEATLKPIKTFGIINYELAWRRPELLKLQNFTLCLDESSLIQNPKAKQTKFILKLRPANVILLSGTPCSGKYENLWTQAHLLGWEISRNLYEKQYVNTVLMNFGGVYVKQVDKNNPYKNVERLKQKFRNHGAVFMKTSEVFDLPEQTFIDIKVDKSKYYKKFMKESYIRFQWDDAIQDACDPNDVGEVELVGDTSLTKLLYARQLCNIYSDEKLDAFEDLLNSTQDRLIVFYNFKAECEALKGVCDALERPVSLVNGSDKDLTNYNERNDSVTLVQYQSGAMGLNLQLANKIVFFSPTMRCEHWMQSLKRIHRIGQEKPCFYYKMIVKDSVEEKIYEALSKGVDYTDELFKKEF